MKFVYQARTKTGEIKTGEIEAFSREAAIEILQRSGLFPTYVEEVKKPLRKKGGFILGKIHPLDLAITFRKLSALLYSGIPILDALNSVARETSSETLKEILFEIAIEIEEGNTLSNSFSRYPQVFPTVYIAMIKTGEVSGELPLVLQRIAENIETNYQFTQKVKGALWYPILIISVAIFVFLLMTFWLLPKLVKFSTEMGVELTSFILFLLKIGEILKKWWFFFLLFFSSILAILLFYFKTSEGKEVFDHLILKLPIFGKLLKMIYINRISQNLNILLASGVPITQALEIIEEIPGNSVYRNILSLARDAIKAGEAVSTFFKDYPEMFPPFFSQMIAVGEKTGTLNKSLLIISEFYTKETERIISNLTSILTPLLIVFAAGIVALLLLSVLTTIYQTITII
jgi:type IV pilus assembly protein PilC